VSDHHIYPSEVLLLLIWLSAPSLLCAWVALIILYIRFGVFRFKHLHRVIFGLIGATIGILAGAVFLWLVVPKSLWSDQVLLPDSSLRGIFVPPVFAPAIAAALLVVPFTAWATLEGLTMRWSERQTVPGPHLK
jgi:hypothetical protein